MGCRSGATTVGARHLPLEPCRARRARGDHRRCLRPGGAFVEEEIAARFDVSRNPIREALRTLSSEGFVEIEPRRGASRSIDATAAGELFELRPAGGPGRQPRRTTANAAQVHRLGAIVDAGRQAAARGRWRSPGVEHRVPRNPCRGRRERPPAQHVGSAGHHPLDLRGSISRRSTKSWDEHGMIVDAVAAGDVDAPAGAARSTSPPPRPPTGELGTSAFGIRGPVCRAPSGPSGTGRRAGTETLLRAMLARTRLQVFAASEARTAPPSMRIVVPVTNDARAGAQERHDVGEALPQCRAARAGSRRCARPARGRVRFRRASPWRPRSGRAPVCRTGR